MTADRIMLDIETLGTDPGATIVSIGAVAFDADGPGDEFRAAVSPTSCQRHGLSIDAETLEWWLTQDAAAREQLRGGADLETALEDLVGMDATKKEVLYEKGLLHEEMGDKEAAIECFKEIYEVDYGYRDVARRVESSYGG